MPTSLTVLALKTLMAVAQAYAAQAHSPQGTPSHSRSITNPPTLGDAADTIIKCYHPTGHYAGVTVLEHPWTGAAAFNAKTSVVLRIDWKGGLVGNRYSSVVALMERNGQIKTVVLNNGSPVPANPRCQLENWTTVQE